MSNIPDNLQYTSDDEWAKIEGDEATIGITDFAQDSLSDIVYLELPDVGDTMAAGDTFGVVESVKAAADLVAPLSGEVTAINEALLDNPELINEVPYEGAWMIKLKMSNASEAEGLFSAESYATDLENR